MASHGVALRTAAFSSVRCLNSYVFVIGSNTDKTTIAFAFTVAVVASLPNAGLATVVCKR
jgi:hypothetical protein